MDRLDEVRLRHMLDAAREALSFIEGKNRSELDANRILVLSLVKEVEIIGEAAYEYQNPPEMSFLQSLGPM